MSKVIYHMEDASRVVHENLSIELQQKFNVHRIHDILETYFIIQGTTSDLETACANRGIFLNEDEIVEIFKAEEIYLQQIGGI